MAGPTRILVVEDDPEVRSAIRMVLEAEAYEVAESGDGADALAKLRVSPQPSLILLDLMMPGMNGWQFMDEVRVHPGLRQVPIVVVSAYGSADGVRSVGATDSEEALRPRNVARRGEPSRVGGAIVMCLIGLAFLIRRISF